MALHKIEEHFRLEAHLFAKIERNNPGGSVKDRVALQMIKDGLDSETIKEGSTLIEATSGNTGIGLAMLGAYYGLKVIIVMPSTMSKERRDLMSAYGAEIILVDGNMSNAVEKANELLTIIPNSVLAGQFINQSNPKAHYLSTGREIYEALDGNIDLFIAGIGTGGTLTGVAKYLKEQNPSIRAIGVEPASSPFLSKGQAGAHKIEGIGAGFKPDILDLSLVDEVLTIEDEEAKEFAKLLALQEGILAGVSSGAALCGAVKLAKQYSNKNIVTLFPDTGERYLSKGLFQ